MPRKKRTTQSKAKKGGRKIALPAFGLAEEILSGQVAAREKEKESEAVRSTTQESLLSHPPEQRTDTIGAGGEAELQLVTFRLDREEYGVEISSVQEIIRVGHITAVPNAPEYVQGVINLRGRILPVLNLRRKFNLPDVQFTKESRIMVVESGGRVLGLIVDGVSQVIKIPLASLEAPPGEVEETKSYVRGIGKIDSRLVMIMDMEKVLMKDARQPAA